MELRSVQTQCVLFPLTSLLLGSQIFKAIQPRVDSALHACGLWHHVAQIWELFEAQGWPANIDWGAFLPQLPQATALFIVVAFGSCMDIAAIQAQHDKEVGAHPPPALGSLVLVRVLGALSPCGFSDRRVLGFQGFDSKP
eukprot:scaffold61938_cov35-Prasinocladus_malaysianus.AAC.1